MFFCLRMQKEDNENKDKMKNGLKASPRNLYLEKPSRSTQKNS
jgi:hypothetical protein